MSAEARVLGKAYYKQIDVLIAQRARGPELMVSTKRLGSSLANNALNRVEESYGDAHNLRGRHPLAAIGYVLVIRKQAMDKSPRSADRLLDLVTKLGSDPAGYDASAVVVVDWDEERGRNGDCRLRLEKETAGELAVGPFLGRLVKAVLDRTPIEAHARARELYAHASAGGRGRCDDDRATVRSVRE
ncbi:hypothetical protein [Nocardioides deserti]|uniref:hypothetical protein n=1 Tax=Nocardioides deserti TaxID=1588644 RepID=UPI001C92CD1B|nr:hypothetical protein [Nocardioides deserti]